MRNAVIFIHFATEAAVGMHLESVEGHVLMFSPDSKRVWIVYKTLI